MSDTMKANLLGREIGECEGWDQLELLSIILYKFVPNEAHRNLPSGDLMIDYEKGEVSIVDDNGETSFQSDILQVLRP